MPFPVASNGKLILGSYLIFLEKEEKEAREREEGNKQEPKKVVCCSFFV